MSREGQRRVEEVPEGIRSFAFDRRSRHVHNNLYARVSKDGERVGDQTRKTRRAPHSHNTANIAQRRPNARDFDLVVRRATEHAQRALVYARSDVSSAKDVVEPVISTEVPLADQRAAHDEFMCTVFPDFETEVLRRNVRC